MIVFIVLWGVLKFFRDFMNKKYCGHIFEFG